MSKVACIKVCPKTRRHTPECYTLFSDIQIGINNSGKKKKKKHKNKKKKKKAKKKKKKAKKKKKKKKKKICYRCFRSLTILPPMTLSVF